MVASVALVTRPQILRLEAVSRFPDSRVPNHLRDEFHRRGGRRRIPNHVDSPQNRDSVGEEGERQEI
jgi:hypothetical protein